MNLLGPDDVIGSAALRKGGTVGGSSVRIKERKNPRF